MKLQDLSDVIALFFLNCVSLQCNWDKYNIAYDKTTNGGALIQFRVTVA